MTPTQRPLVQRFYKQIYRKSKIKAGDVVWIATKHEQPLVICAALRMQRVIENNQSIAWFLTGLAVHPEYRGQHPKLGQQLQVTCFEHSETLPIYCFVEPSLQRYYGELGFQTVAVPSLPPSLSYRLAKYCGIPSDGIKQWREGQLPPSQKLLPLVKNL